jgi:hypothetical protein
MSTKIEIRGVRTSYGVSDERGHLGVITTETCAWTIPEGQRVTWCAGDAQRGTAASVAEAAEALVAARDAEHDAGHIPHIPTRAA